MTSRTGMLASGRSLKILGVGVLLAWWTACGSPAEKVFRVTAISDATPDQLREKNAKISAWLGHELGVQVEFVPVTKYSAAVAAIVSGRADFAWLGGVTTVHAMQQSRDAVIPLVTRASDRKFKSYFIAHRSVGARSLSDLRGKRFAFGSTSSTSGHIMPRHFLKAQHEILRPEEFFGSVAYTGSHPLTVRQVADRTVDAGVVNYKTFDGMVARGEVDPKEVEIVWTTPEFVDYAWCVHRDVEARFGVGTVERLREAFVDLDPEQPRDAEVLGWQSARRFEVADPRWWDPIASVLEHTEIK